MIDALLRDELEQVGTRIRKARRVGTVAAGAAALAAAGAGVLLWHGDGTSPWLTGTLVGLLAAPVIAWPIVRASFRRTRDPLWVARRVEERFPDVDSALLAALEQKPADGSGTLGYLQHAVVGDALRHARANDWAGTLVSDRRLRLASAAQGAACLAMVAVAGAIGLRVIDLQPARSGPDAIATVAGESTRVTVEPGHASVERGTSLLVLARFDGRLPGDVQLLAQDTGAAEPRVVPMSKSLNDPVFAARLPSVSGDLRYAVRYGDGLQTDWFSVSTFVYPDLARADAKLDYPEYTKLPDRTVEDVRSVTAVEGTRATFTFRLNKPDIANATLVPSSTPAPPKPVDGAAAPTPAPAEPVKLVARQGEPGVYTADLDLKQSQRYRLHLTDADGRKNKLPPELALNVNPNRPPELKPVYPGRDVDVSAIEELRLGEKVWDDFGVSRTGLTFSIAGEPPQDVVLASDVPAKEQREVGQVVALESLGAKPDQLLSYYFWAEDVGPDGQPRRTAGDMFFAEVRPFEQIFRQGEQPTADQQQQQQQQQQNGQNSAAGQQAEQLAELQKQVISATWKVMRRETNATLTPAFGPDVKLIAESQASAREQAAAIEENLTDAKSLAHLKAALQFMDRASAELSTASEGNTVAPLAGALAAEQSAYQALLKLRAREYEVVRGNQQQQQGQQQQGQSSASTRRQQQLNELELEQDRNRYEAQRSAQQQQQPQQEDPSQREARQVLNRLRELAQRQEDLNRQVKELQATLDEAKEQAQREEIQRQLSRLRDQQQQQLRDADELRDRMDQPENQQRMAEAREQLEQSRENVRRASEALEQGRMPEAATAGERAAEGLNNLREEVRRSTSGQFNDQMTQMREAARDLEAEQKRLAERLANLNNDAAKEPQRSSLRDNETAPNAERDAVARQLDEQRKKLEGLLDAARRTVDDAEASEPLLSRQLYDAVRQATQQQTGEALDATRQLVQRGFDAEARQAEAEAGQRITQLREGVERAATSVLGDEAEALRRARGELDRLSQDLRREVDRNRPSRSSDDRAATDDASPTTRPGSRASGDGTPTTQPRSAATSDGRRPTTRPDSRAVSGAGPTTRPESSNGGGPTTRPGSRSTSNGEPTTRPNASTSSDDRRDPSTDGGQPRATTDPRSDGQQPGEGRRQGRPADGRNPAPSGAERPGNRDQPREPQDGQGQPGEGQQPGESPGDRGQPDGQQPGQGNQPGEGGQPREPQDGRGRSGQGNQPGEGNQPGQGDQPGVDGQPGDPSQTDAQPGAPPGARRAGGLRGGRGQGEPTRSDPQARRPADPTTPPDDEPRDGDPRRDGEPTNDAGSEVDGGGGGGWTGPFGGDNFREWSDRLRDVEEMVNDPRLRGQAARIRERARELRAEFKRHSAEPNWDLLSQEIGVPLAELRDAVSQELRRRDSKDALVPIDADSVPPEYADQVRRYYERLGSGK